MNNKFTVEEVNLICIFECKSRTKVISDIKKAIKYLDCLLYTSPSPRD